MAIILLFILILNVVAILLTYYSLSDIDKKEKLIFIAVGIAVSYMLTSIVYGISTNGIEMKEVSEVGKNFITFTFVPINAILVLPILAKSYGKYKIGKLATDKFRNRIILMLVVLFIMLVIECSYFKEIQNGVISLIESKLQA